ncbi:MAG: penicillin-binding protein activator LpoB [Treponema sp.]|nr:penicillin-binding protein activator LpoB [Treponema sp.]
MKKSLSVFAVLFVFAFVFSSCGSTSVERIGAEENIDLDGYWNESDVAIVCNSLIEECSKSSAVAGFTKKNKRVPVAIIGKIRNESSEHIDTSIIEKKFQNAIVNSGAMEFVSNSSERQYLREEKADQAEHATMETAKELDSETGADYMLLGSVKSIVQVSANKNIRTYYVYVELHDIKTNKILWMSENSSIRKVVSNPKYKF